MESKIIQKVSILNLLESYKPFHIEKQWQGKQLQDPLLQTTFSFRFKVWFFDRWQDKVSYCHLILYSYFQSKVHLQDHQTQPMFNPHLLLMLLLTLFLMQVHLSILMSLHLLHHTTLPWSHSLDLTLLSLQFRIYHLMSSFVFLILSLRLEEFHNRLFFLLLLVQQS